MLKQYIAVASVSVMLLLTISGRAQNAENTAIRTPQFDDIEVVVSDASSPYYYDLLMLRYAKNDTMLNALDYHYLYYGYALQEDYNPISDSPWQDSVKMVLNLSDTLVQTDYLRLEDFLQRLLVDKPFSIRDLNALAFVYSNLQQKALAKEQLYKVDMINHTIKSSGRGEVKDSPWWVVTRENAVDMMALMGFIGERETVIGADVIYLGENNRPFVKNHGYYFDIRAIYKYLQTKSKELGPTKRKMEFNSKYNPWSKNNILPPKKRR